jgi:hypothetical protein
MTPSRMSTRIQNYALLMNSFAIPGQGSAVLRELSTNNPQDSSVGYIICNYASSKQIIQLDRVSCHTPVGRYMQEVARHRD